MAARRDFQGLPKPRPWQQILSFHVRLSTIFNVERLCLVLPAPLVSEFLLFSGWVSSSEWIGRNCQRSNSWGLGCYRKTLWYEALGYSAWELSPSASPAPRLLACAQIAFVVHLGKSAFPPFPAVLFSKSQRARLCLCGCPASQHLGGGQHHSHPRARGCSSDLS